MNPFTRFLVLAASLTMFPGAVFAQSNLSELVWS